MPADYKADTLAAYEAEPEHFVKKFFDAFNLKTRTEFGKIIELVPRDSLILDVGCAGGAHSEYFTKQGLRVIGIDLSPALVTIAKRKGLDARVMDYEALTFPDQTFDCVFCNASLLHTPKARLAPVLIGLARILRPGGLLFVKVKEGEGEQYVTEHGTKRFFSFWQMDELVETLGNQFTVFEFYKDSDQKTVWLNVFCRKEAAHG